MKKRKNKKSEENSSPKNTDGLMPLSFLEKMGTKEVPASEVTNDRVFSSSSKTFFINVGEKFHHYRIEEELGRGGCQKRYVFAGCYSL